MTVAAMVIETIYILFSAFIAILLLWNFKDSRNVHEEILYAIVLVPFVLRVIQLK